MKLVSVCMSLRGWSQTLYLFADKCHRLQLLGVSAVMWVRGGKQEVLVLQGEWTKPESGGLAVKQLGRGDDNMTMLKATSRPPSGNPGFMTQVSTCRFLLANLHSPPAPTPYSPLEKSSVRVAVLHNPVKGHCYKPKMRRDITVACLLRLDLHRQMF